MPENVPLKTNSQGGGTTALTFLDPGRESFPSSGSGGITPSDYAGGVMCIIRFAIFGSVDSSGIKAGQNLPDLSVSKQFFILLN